MLALLLDGSIGSWINTTPVARALVTDRRICRFAYAVLAADQLVAVSNTLKVRIGLRTSCDLHGSDGVVELTASLVPLR